jgi:hypothetical protein
MFDLLPVIVIVSLLGFILVFLCLALALKVILWPFRALSRPSERKQPSEVL